MSGWRHDLHLFVRLLRLLRPHAGWMALGIALSLASSLAGIGLLAVAGWFLASMGLAGAAGATLDYFTPAASIRAFALVRTGGRYLERLVDHEATLRVLSGLRVWLFGRLLPRAPARTAFLGDAELFARLRADVDRLEHAFLGVLVPCAVAVLAVPAVLLVQVAYSPSLALPTAVAAVAVGVLVPLRQARRGALAAARTVELEAAQRALALDTLRGAPELALYGLREARGAALLGLDRERAVAAAQVDATQARAGAAVPLAAQWTVAATLSLAAAAAHAGAVRPADVAMLVMLGMAVFEVLMQLPEALVGLRAVLASAGRVFALADAVPAVVDPARPAPAPVRADLHLRGVRLRYSEDAPWVLDGLDLDLPAGSRVLLEGASGAGKSSLLAVLLRLQPFQDGCIELDGRPLAAYAGDDVRALFAVAEQRPHIFDASLRDNLLLACPGAGAEQLASAVRDAQLEAFVAGLPEGYDTWLGEGGVRISGGEARRVAIARALLADRPALILDEPGEGLDASTARALFAALARRLQGRTVLVISHRGAGLEALAPVRKVLRAGRLHDGAPVCGGTTH